MSAEAEACRDLFSGPPDEVWPRLQAAFDAAARAMSPAGLGVYAEGARALGRLGRGDALLFAYLEAMPALVRDCGEDILPDCVAAAMKLSSMTSGEVIAMMFTSLPVAAQRLGDAELLRAYLALIHQLSARAARGLRPMLGQIDLLLSRLTLSGLRRWAMFGAEAHRRDLPNLIRYFSLDSPDARKMLQQERRGTLFVDSQRRLNFYLRALWGRDFFLRPAASDHAGFRPYLEDRIQYLPDALDDLGELSGYDLYRAMAAHQAAHLIYTSAPLSAEQLSPAQMALIGMIEDARVEFCAARDFPGLGKLWRAVLAQPVSTPPPHPSLPQLEQLARALLDPATTTGMAELGAIAARFHSQIAARCDDNRLSWDLGLELFHIFQARRAMPSLRLLESIRLPHRDDNRFVWAFEEFDWSRSSGAMAADSQIRKYVSVMEMAHEVDTELAGDDAQEIWVCKDTFRPYEDAGEATTSFNAIWGKEPVAPPVYYPEWDHRLQLHRPDWATVNERRAAMGDPARIDEILARHRPVAHRIRQIIDMLSPVGVQRQRGLEDGDEIDLNAAIDAMIAIRMGAQPSPRITMRNVIQSRDLAVTVLLDLSESTNDMVPGLNKTVLELTREAAALVALAIDGIGDPFALHGFASDGRHDVQYLRFKDFDQRFDREAKARLAGMQGGLSTRMGAALRHAGAALHARPERRKLILLVTDGAPADIDERDPQHLRQDARRAVEELSSKGVLTYCLTLDGQADSYVKRIFGANNYSIVDHVDRLPETLPLLFADLTA